jgi:hypothetical protein
LQRRGCRGHLCRDFGVQRLVYDLENVHTVS